MFTRVKTADEIAGMRESGRMLATVLRLLADKLEVGMTTKDLADIASLELRGLGGQPAFLGYQGFPDVLCVSINEEVVHGIPSKDRLISDGDIVSMDFGVKYQGMVTDSAVSVVAGKSGNAQIDSLLRHTKAALLQGIDALKGGVKVGDVAAAIETYISSQGNYGIVRELVGHGVGHELHEEPNIPNYGMKGQGEVLKSGMTIAIEPMLTLGSEDISVGSDGWTVSTADGSLSAHYEHTVLVTDDGAEILTTL